MLYLAVYLLAVLTFLIVGELTGIKIFYIIAGILTLMLAMVADVAW